MEIRTAYNKKKTYKNENSFTKITAYKRDPKAKEI